MRRSLPDGSHRYQYLNTWATDGTRVFRVVADTKARASTPKQYKIDNKDTLEKIKKAAGDQEPLKYFEAIVGIDPGHVYPAAAFSLSTKKMHGTQLKISNRFLYGRQRKNQRWLEEKKAKDEKEITSLETELSINPGCRASLASFLRNVRAWQSEQRFLVLPEFYNSSAVSHRYWDSRISSTSSLDKACELLERLPGLPHSTQQQQQSHDRRFTKNHEHEKPKQPCLFVMGDASFSTTRRGLMASKHVRLANCLVQRLHHRYPSSIFVGVDEYMTSQRCPRCMEKLQYLKRKPRSAGEAKNKGMDAEGLVKDFRVQYCQPYVTTNFFLGLLIHMSSQLNIIQL
jgi:hypothetical protein